MTRSALFAPGKSLLSVGFLVCFMTAPLAPSAFGEDPGKVESGKRSLSSLPRIKRFKPPPDDNAYRRLMHHNRDKQRYRGENMWRLFPVRATEIPPPPFKAEMTTVLQGVAIELNHPMGSRWTTSSTLVDKASFVEIQDHEGLWHKVEVRRPCETSPLTILEGIPDSILEPNYDSRLRLTLRRLTRPTGTRGFDLRNPETLTEALPVLAVKDIRSATPSLHMGKLKARIPSKVGQSWTHSLLVTPGTPLLDVDGRVVLIQTSFGKYKTATSPQDGFRCAEEINTERDPAKEDTPARRD